MKLEAPMTLIYQTLKALVENMDNKEIQTILLEPAKAALQVLEEFRRPEEARRTKRVQGNKYDEHGLLGDIRNQVTNDEIWSEPEICTKLNREISITHLLNKMVKQGWLKKGGPADFVNFNEQRGAQSKNGCRTFYQLIPSVTQITEISKLALK
jgi:hypothetical protein